jgi:rhamnulokinase
LYAKALATVEELTGRSITKLHIVGGGSQSALLNQFAASATGRNVLAGPVEATAVGNVLLQATALGDLESLGELRAVVRNSFPIEVFEPRDGDSWKQAGERLAGFGTAS